MIGGFQMFTLQIQKLAINLLSEIIAFATVKVKDGMSLLNGMWLGLRNDIIMRNLFYGK